MMHKESIDALENISSHSRESMTKAQIRNITTKDVSCGPDSYVTAGRQGQSYEILREDLSTDSNSQKMRDKNVGTNEIASWTGNIPSLHENILEHSTNGNLYSQLWDNLQSDREIVETPKSTRLSKDDCNYRILYMDGYGNSKTLPHDVSIQLKSWLFPSSSKSSNQYSV